MTEDSDDGTRKVVAFARYFRFGEGEFDEDWRLRWEPELAEDMKVEMLGGVFFEPMARQHRAAMGERAHYCRFILVTLQENHLFGWELTGSSSRGPSN